MSSGAPREQHERTANPTKKTRAPMSREDATVEVVDASPFLPGSLPAEEAGASSQPSGPVASSR
jgi:hypothetical protein